MATYVTAATGNITSASVFALVDSTSLLDSEANNTALTTSYVASSSSTTGAITIDGICVKIFSRSASPTGTMSVELYNASLGASVAGTEVTVNVSDLPVMGWVNFKFSASVLLLAATSYQVRAKTSSSSQVNLYRNSTAGNWSRMLRTTTLAALAANDNFHLAGERTGAGTGNDFTITIDNTATTSFGSVTPPQSMTISKGALLDVATSASTNYYLKIKGQFKVFPEGEYDFTMLDDTSSLTVHFNPTSNVDSGLVIANGAITTAYGETITNLKSPVTSNVTAGGGTVDVASTAGWANGDEIVITPTATTASQFEKRTINSVVSGTQFTTTATFTNAHSGTSPTQAQVALLNRNIIFRGESSSLQGYITKESGGSFDHRYCRFYFLGSSTTNKRGIEHQGTGTFNLIGCSIHDFSSSGATGSLVATGAQGDFLIEDNTYYNCSSHSILLNGALTATTYSIDNNIVIGTGSSGGAAGIALGDVGGTITNNHVSGSSSSHGIALSESGGTIGTISGNTCHTNAGSGISCAANVVGTVTSSTTWRNAASGIAQTFGEIIWDGHTAFGNVTSNFSFGGGTAIINSPIWNAGTTNTCPVGLALAGSGLVYVNDASSGATTTHSTGDINVSGTGVTVFAHLNNCTLSSGVEIANQTNLSPSSYIGSQKHDGTEGNNKGWRKYGNATIDTTIYDVSPSLRLTPNNASGKFETFQTIQVAVTDGSTVSVSIKVRESVSGDGTDYNGNRPRLIVKKNVSCGITSDTVLDTATASAEGAFETLSGTTATVTADGVLEFYCDCDGTTGWVNIDTFAVTSSPTDSTGYKYWRDGFPVVYGDNQLGGGGSFAFA